MDLYESRSRLRRLANPGLVFRRPFEMLTISKPALKRAIEQVKQGKPASSTRCATAESRLVASHGPRRIGRGRFSAKDM